MAKLIKPQNYLMNPTGATEPQVSPAKDTFIKAVSTPTPASIPSTPVDPNNPSAGKWWGQPPADPSSFQNVNTTPGSTAPEPVKSPSEQAFDSYLQSLQPDAAVTQATKYVNDLVTQSELDQERALGMGETLGFATGEAGRVGRQNAILLGGRSRALEALTGQQTQKQTAAKARLDYEQSKIKQDTRSGFDLSPGQERWEYDATTGEYKQIAKAPEDMSDAEYKKWQVKNLESQIKERNQKSVDTKQYTIPSTVRNQLMAYNLIPSEVDAIQEDIRKYGLEAVLANQDADLQEILRATLDKGSLIY